MNNLNAHPYRSFHNLFTGFASRVAILLTALNAAAQPTCVDPPPGALSWWQGGNSTFDQIGTNHGTLAGNATYTNAYVGQGFVFDGSGDAVKVGNPPGFQLQDFTIEAWIKRGSDSAVSFGPGGHGIIFGYGQGGYSLLLIAGGNLGLSKVGFDSVDAGVAITDTSFHHVAVTKSGTNVFFYIDDVEYMAPPYGSSFTFTTGAAIGARGDNSDNSFLGTLDEVAVYNRALSAAEIQSLVQADTAGKCFSPKPPFIQTQPTNRNVIVGQNTTFTLTVATGSLPLSYQWRYNNADLAGATNSALTLTNVQFSQSGNYSVMVTNIGGSVTSSYALLTTVFPPASVRIFSNNVTAGGTLNVPVVLVANGNENALSFSLSFDTAKLTYANTTLGSGASNAVLIPNTSIINSGKLGLSIALPDGATFNPGTQQVAQVSFVAAVLTNSSLTTNIFGDQPAPRQLLDAQFNTLSATYSNGVIAIIGVTNFEGDLAPRANPDRIVALSDWLLMGRFVARLDAPTNGTEFQRADCAPRSTRGNGLISITDWVQAGRYLAGLDPLTPAGGPTNDLAVSGAGSSTNRLLTVGGLSFSPGQTGTASVTLASQGNENALAFSLAFDPTGVAYNGASLGVAAAGANLLVNTNQVGSGRLGFALILGSGINFTTGIQEVLKINLHSLPSASGNSALAFSDQIVPREISDTNAVALPVSYVNATLTVNSLPTLKIFKSGSSVILSWPLWATNFGLQEAPDRLAPTPTWSNLSVSTFPSNNESMAMLPFSSTNKFYRLFHP